MSVLCRVCSCCSCCAMPSLSAEHATPTSTTPNTAYRADTTTQTAAYLPLIKQGGNVASYGYTGILFMRLHKVNGHSLVGWCGLGSVWLRAEREMRSAAADQPRREG